MSGIQSPPSPPRTFPYGMQSPMLYGQPLLEPMKMTRLQDLQQAQMYEYVSRMQYAYGFQGYYPPTPPMFYTSPYQMQQTPERTSESSEVKPSQNYIELIGQAILSSPEEKMLLGDIYTWIMDNHSYFRNRGQGWKNSIRHNLSLNDCFIKLDRSFNGKGHYWSIHPANIEDFKKGCFGRRHAKMQFLKYVRGDGFDSNSDLHNGTTPAPPNLNGSTGSTRLSSGSENSPVSFSSASSHQSISPSNKKRKYVSSLISMEEDNVKRQRLESF